MPINPLDQGSDDPNQEDQDKKNQISSGESVNVTGEGSTPAAGGGVSTPAPASSPSKSGSFTNLNQYLEANKDQAQGLGGKLEENVQKSANVGLQDLSKSQQEFNTAQQAVSADPNKYNTANVLNTVQNAVYNPSGVQQSDIDAFNTVRSQNAAFQAGTDTAPKDLTENATYQTAGNELGQAEQNAQLTGTESGRQTLLQQAFQRPNYSQGQVALDQLLTQNTPENRQRLEDLRTNLLGQYGLANQQTQAVQNAAAGRQQAITDTQQAANNISNVLTGTAPAGDNSGQYGILTQYAQQLQSKPDQLMAEQAQAKQQALDYLTNYYKSQPTYGIDPASLAAQLVGSASPGAATVQNSLSSDEIARLNVLNKLAGNDPNQLGSTTLGNPDTNLFNPSATIDYTKAPQQIKDAAAVYSNKIQTQANQALTGTPVNIHGTNLNGQKAIDYVLSRMNYRMTGPAYNTEEANTAINAFQGQIDTLNSTRSQYGLPALTATPVPVSQIINELGQAAAAANGNAGRPQWSINDITNKYNTEPVWRDVIDAKAKLMGISALLQQVQANPFMGATGQAGTPAPLQIPGTNAQNMPVQTFTPGAGLVDTIAPERNPIAQPQPIFGTAPTKQ